jgi:hypothetical protein
VPPRKAQGRDTGSQAVQTEGLCLRIAWDNDQETTASKALCRRAYQHGSQGQLQFGAVYRKISGLHALEHLYQGFMAVETG